MLIYSISKETELENIPKWTEWLELRIDLCFSLLDYLSKLTAYKVIITDRWSGEGGKSMRSIKEKKRLYQSVIAFQNLYFDLEIELLADVDELTIDSKRIILSYHNFHSLDLINIQNKLAKAKNLNPYFIKIAQYCTSLKEVSDLYQVINRFNGDVLWLVMGQYGKLQRLLHPCLDSQATFISSVGAETVEGQLNLSDVEKNQHLLSSKPFKWGGLIGGNQVYDSLGLEFYNSYFNKNRLKAVYLPISLKESDLPAFFDLIRENHKLRENCYGFSLTMPFKQLIPKLFNHRGINNLLIYNSKPQFYSTDYDAFVKIKSQIKDLPIKSVLIYGAGSMAQMALTIFENYDVFLAGRNKVSLLKLKEQRKNIVIIDQISPELYFDLLINTSPLGMKGEDFSQETGIRKFKYVIDLPYSQAEIPLQKEVEFDNYISGREFWLYQSERQLQLFKERIEND